MHLKVDTKLTIPISKDMSHLHILNYKEVNPKCPYQPTSTAWLSIEDESPMFMVHMVSKCSLVPGLPDLSMYTRKKEEPGIQPHVTNIIPYTKVGRVVGCDN